MIRFSNQLHIAILDTVVHHLDKVTTAVGAHPIAAWFSTNLIFRVDWIRYSGRTNLGGDLLEDGFHMFPGLLVTAGHDRRTVAGALFATTDSGADEVETGLAERCGTALKNGILKREILEKLRSCQSNSNYRRQ